MNLQFKHFEQAIADLSATADYFDPKKQYEPKQCPENFLKEPEENRKAMLAQYNRWLSCAIEDSVKFYLPQAGYVLNDDFFDPNNDEDYQHLPFELTALYTTKPQTIKNETSMQQIIVAIQDSESKEFEFGSDYWCFHECSFYPEMGQWITKGLSAWSFPKTNNDKKIALIESDLQSEWEKELDSQRASELREHGYKSGRDECHDNVQLAANRMTGLLKLLDVNGCETKEINYPFKLRRKHKKKKHQNVKLCDSYHVLKIGGEVWDSPYSSIGTGSGSAKRSHLRRGHIRRLNDKNVWVRQAYVKGRKLGFVNKDYEVKNF